MDWKAAQVLNTRLHGELASLEKYEHATIVGKKMDIFANTTAMAQNGNLEPRIEMVRLWSFYLQDWGEE